MKKIISVMLIAFIFSISFNVQPLADTITKNENITNVTVKSVEEFRKNIITAICSKKDAVFLEVNNYTDEDYSIDKIKEYISMVNFEKCFQKGYTACYGINISVIGSFAKINIEFNYSDLTNFNAAAFKKVLSVNDFNTAIGNAIFNKMPSITLALKGYDAQNYIFDKNLSFLKDEKILTKGYYPMCNGISWVDALNHRVINIKFDYHDLPNNYSDIYKINLYKNFYSSIYNIFENQDTCSANYKPVVKSSEDWYKYIKTAIMNCEEKIVYDNARSVDINDTIKTVLSHNPDIDYIHNYLLSSDGVIQFSYKFEKKKLQEMVKEINKKVKQIISRIIKPDMTDVEKAKAIHNYIIINSKYDYDNYVNGKIPPESYTAYGVLVKGTGVCQGYTAAFNLLAKAAGIKSMGVCGQCDGGAHSWSMVKLDGKVRYIDVTWDDPVPDMGKKVRYDYFNITEKQIQKDHKWNKKEFSEKYLDY